MCEHFTKITYKNCCNFCSKEIISKRKLIKFFFFKLVNKIENYSKVKVLFYSLENICVNYYFLYLNYVQNCANENA